MKHLYGNLAAAAAATIWGIFFLVAKVSLLDLPVLNVIAYRYILACLPFIILLIAKRQFPNKNIIKMGIILGVILFAADFFQLTGISLTTVSSSALLSQGLIIFTPIFLLLLGRTIKKFDFLRAGVAFFGIYLFAVKDSISSISAGDVFVLLFSIIISVYFIVNKRFVRGVWLIQLLAVQFLTEGAIGVILSFFTTGISIPSSNLSWLPILYLGFAATALAWGLNSWAQKRTEPHHIVVLYVLEPLVAGILAFAFFAEVLSAKELIGAAIIIFSIVMPVLRRRKKEIKAGKREK